MRLHEAAAMLRPGQRLRMSEIGAVEPLEPGDKRPREGFQEAGTRRWWTPPMTDAQILAYWNRIVLKMVRPHGGNEVFVIVTPTDGVMVMKGERRNDEGCDDAGEPCGTDLYAGCCEG